ncbi:MAG TPA: acyl-CoA dehydrogenase family protein [Ktedonobacterales bacterium]|nr:acyl-CoA dehydrogenase family protein [Ktedonobacterales bacterium]
MTGIGYDISHAQANQASIASAAPSERPEPGGMPDTRAVNFYDANHYLRFLLRRKLDPEELAAAESRLRDLGGRVGSELEDLAAEADRESPPLIARDKRGEPINDVLPSRAYRDLERILYGEFGMAAMAMRPGIIQANRASSLVLNDAFTFLAAQAESGLFCPLSMTRAMARTLLKFAPEAIIRDYLPDLLSTNMETLQTGAMFMTEKQGGSDLGTVATTARPSADNPDWWELNGDKWFCSNVGADLILALARPEGAGPGTRGLGLFLAPKHLPDGRRNSYRIERVKDKLGMRSFASGEVTFAGTLALLIGGPGQGWLQMTEMLNITRLGCALAASALAQRSLIESLTHARGRTAFGKPLADLPLMREQLLDLMMDTEALTALTFEGSAQLDRADAGNEEARILARVLTPLAKYHVSDEGRRLVAEGMEVRGGNSYIEDWPNARMLRDVQVQSIWEGTGNISALDVGRALVREQAGATLVANLTRRLAAQDDPAVVRAAAQTQRALDRLAATITEWATRASAERDLRMRRLTRQLAHVVTAALLVEDAGAQASLEGNYRCLVMAARYLRRYVYPPRDGLANDRDYTPLDAFDALVEWTPVLPAEAAKPLLSTLEREAW